MDKAVSGTPLRLSIFEPPVRLGDPADFSGLKVSDAGEVRRPDVAESPEAMCDLTTGLIWVRNDEGRVIGSWDPKVEPLALKARLGHMPLIRELDRRMLLDQRQGRFLCHVQSMGEEAFACALRTAPSAGDMNCPTHRQPGLPVAGNCPLE